MKIQISIALLSLVLLVPACHGCGSFDVDYECTQQGTGTPCEELQPRDAPGWPCATATSGCATSLRFKYTGQQCGEHPLLRDCKHSVFNEACEMFDEEGNDWVTECLEHQPKQVKVTATSADGDLLYVGEISEGDEITLYNNGQCIPNEVVLLATELDGFFDNFGTDFFHRVEIVSGSEPMPTMFYGGFRLLDAVCEAALHSLSSSMRRMNHTAEECFTSVDLNFCVYTDSTADLDLRFDTIRYNKATIISADFAPGDIPMSIDLPWCRTMPTMLDLCRREHSFFYEFGIFNTECQTTTSVLHPRFYLGTVKTTPVTTSGAFSNSLSTSPLLLVGTLGTLVMCAFV
jgi:hypothetical protein